MLSHTHARMHTHTHTHTHTNTHTNTYNTQTHAHLQTFMITNYQLFTLCNPLHRTTVRMFGKQKYLGHKKIHRPRKKRCN